jgi:hypothetical protein
VADSAAPGIHPVYAGDRVVTGTGEPGAAVVVTFPGGATATATVGSDGSWQVNVPSGVNLGNDDIVRAVQTEAGKNSSEPRAVVVIGREESDPPVVDPVNQNDDKITGEGVPGAEIVVCFPEDDLTVVVTVDDDGKWEAEIPETVDLDDGDVIEVIQKEPGKDPSDPATEVVVGSGDGGRSVADSAAPGIHPVYAGDRVITGTGVPGATVVVTFPDGTKTAVIVKSDGTWQAPVPAGVSLRNDQLITAVQTEAGKNPSEPYETLVIGSSESQPPKVNPIGGNDTSITGEGTPGSTITVTFPDGTKVTTEVKPDGTWTVTIPGSVDLKDGDVVKVVQKESGKNPSDPVTEVVVGSGNGGSNTGGGNNNNNNNNTGGGSGSGSGVTNAGGGNNGGSGTSSGSGTGSGSGGSGNGGNGGTGNSGNGDTGAGTGNSGNGDADAGNNGDSGSGLVDEGGDNGEIIAESGNSSGGSGGGFRPPLLPAPSTVIDPSSIDPNNPPRYVESIDPSLIPQGWVQVHKTDPDTGDEYWTLEPDMIALGVMVPKTGGNPNVFNFCLMLLLVLCFVGSCLVIEKRSYQGKHCYQNKHCKA